MKENEIFESEETANGFRVQALLQNGALSVQVDEQEMHLPSGSKDCSKVWLIRSRVVIVLPASRAQAQRLIEQHTDAYDVSLRERLEPVWELWSAVPLRDIAQRPISPTIN